MAQIERESHKCSTITNNWVDEIEDKHRKIGGKQQRMKVMMELKRIERKKTRDENMIDSLWTMSNR